VIVDANVHATRDGTWFSTGLDASLGRLLGELDRAGVERAVLTGLTGACPTEDVLALCGEAGGRLIPVAAFDPSAHDSPEAVRRAAREQLAGRGLLGVKLHPRLGRYDVLDDRVLALLDELAGWDERLGVWICTLLHVPGLRLRRGPVEALCELVGRTPELPFVLVHGGGPDLLRLATAVRSAPNALLDLSYTVTHLGGSSIDADLAHLLQTFDERLVFGSDFPEGDVSEALARLAAPPNVLGGNLARVFDLAAAA
jgi:uncharacterized protein